MNELLCLDSIPSVLGVFDFSIAPPLLFYSYIPIMFLTIFVGISLAFSFWILSVLVQWTAAQADVVMFAWQMLVVFEIAIYIFSLYFLFAFLNKKDITFFYKGLGATVFSACIILLPTAFNIVGFDIINCEGAIGELWDFIHRIFFIKIKKGKKAKVRDGICNYRNVFVLVYILLLQYYRRTDTKI